MSLCPNLGPVHLLRCIAAGAAIAALGSCAAVPDLGPTIKQVSARPQAPHIVTPRGPLSVHESRKIIARLAGKPGEKGDLQRHAAIEEALAERPLIGGNRTRVLRDGWESFPAMFQLMRAARSSINLEYYILEDIRSGGESLSDLLISKRHQGVAVNVLFDSYGSADTPVTFFDRLRAAGVRLLEFNPLDPLKARTPYAPNDRDHRKILIVDGAHAIVGGVNLSTKYQPNPIGKSTARASDMNLPWRDTDIQIDGPAVAELQALFLDHWRAQRGPALDTAGFFPHLVREGPAVVRVLGSTPNDKDWSYYASALSAIRNAAKSIRSATRCSSPPRLQYHLGLAGPRAQGAPGHPHNASAKPATSSAEGCRGRASGIRPRVRDQAVHQRVRRLKEFAHRRGVDFARVAIAIERAAHQGRGVECGQQDARQSVVRLPVVEVAEYGIEPVRLADLAEEPCLRREVLARRRDVRSVSDPGEKLSGIVCVPCQVVQPLGECVAAGEVRIDRQEIGDDHAEKAKPKAASVIVNSCYKPVLDDRSPTPSVVRLNPLK